jgi:hypothetical protein
MFEPIKVDESVRDYVESLDYEYSSRKDAITFMLSNNMNINTDAFRAYQKEMAEFSAMFNTAKREIEKQYVLPIIGDKKVTWTLDYSTCILTIEEVA